MSFCFYPKLEVSCPNVAHCPHLGGAALGKLVQIANDNLESNCNIHRTIDTERDKNEELLNSTVLDLSFVYVQWCQAFTLSPMIEASKLVASEPPLSFVLDAGGNTALR